ncbi:hypothetical protein SAMN05444398_11758 [Roseovarius pacificus]|uniref:NrS-1 polymerase-like helicase domain-containing protein n=1 Tax=Roseovarius pacificus TaxID=337701 RepID=A0A1M7IZW1_9RHOB|nr:primase-helicase family protein [Roseovarius pacificus]GGO61723.1 hypothetical protein GCM10011315_39060 [Roseovarius pacificus]SHM46286.1 hypothetical protein SAMN05444398_11758 [Roseovarius pacificus]
MTEQLKLIKNETATQKVGGDDRQTTDEDREAAVSALSTAISSWYVRKDSKYFAVDRLNVKLSKDDVQHACLIRIKEEYGKMYCEPAILKDVFRRTFEAKHFDREQAIPVWSGGMVCRPRHDDRYVWRNGTVEVNTWKKPAYRDEKDVKADFGLAGHFLDVFFTRDEERKKFLDWLSWSLQNEDDKPAWAPLLYSETKGSGKSTLCKLVARLFGEENTLVQNSVEKLTGRFNMPVLTSKLVISEEVNLKGGSSQGNALKTYITETATVSERKGVDAEKVKQFCCFLFTTNHLPLWIEAADRRYYLIEVDHDGHASGQNALEFSGIVGGLHEFMQDDRKIAALYRALMERKQSPGFNARTLNVVDDATPLMRRVHGASEATRKTLLRECLAERGIHALPEQDIVKIVKGDLDGNISSTKHLMSELGWWKDKVKWGGCDYVRAIWVEKGYCADRGKLKGPDGFEENLAEHFGMATDVRLAFD